jgi:hypothetical protein
MQTWRARTRVFAIAASVVAHGVFFIALVWRLGTTPERAEPPVMNVELAPPWTRPEPPRERRVQRAVAASPKSAPVRHRSAVAPEEEEELAGVPAPVVRGSAGGVQAALRGLMAGGGGVAQTPEERRRCDARLAEGRGAAGPRLNLDVRGAFAEETTPYLARKPKKGCKVGAGGDVDPMGKVGAAAGLNCAWAF